MAAPKRGRPKLELNEQDIENLASIQCTDEEIAAVLGCSSDTLTRNYAEALQRGKAKGRASLRRRQWKASQDGNATLLIWLGKQILGQRDQSDVNLGGQPDNPLKVEEVKRTIVHKNA